MPGRKGKGETGFSREGETTLNFCRGKKLAHTHNSKTTQKFISKIILHLTWK